MKKQFAAISAIALSLTTCSTPASAQVTPYQYIMQSGNSNSALSAMIQLSMETQRKLSIEKQELAVIAKQAKLDKMQEKLDNKITDRVSELKKYVDKTWYVFSGSTPSGWDCSGLVMWFYQGLDVALEHRASVQKNSGELVKEPKVGDIVSFTFSGSSGAFHTGIYIGNGKMIHSPKKGLRTSISDVSDWAEGNGSVKVSYTRVLSVN